MFELFTDRARTAIVHAQEESRKLRHDYIGPEHLLLGIIICDSPSTNKVFEKLGITYETLLEHVKELSPMGSRELSHGHTPFTPESKELLEASLREASVLAHNYIGPEHLLLGAAYNDGGQTALRVLSGFDIEQKQIRREVYDALINGGQEISEEILAIARD